MVLCLLFSHNTLAICSCERVSLELAYGQSSNVFEAVVRSVDAHSLKLEEKKVYKGVFYSRLEVVKSDCPVNFEAKKRYVFFLKSPQVRSLCEPHFEVTQNIQYDSLLKIINKQRK